MILQQKYLPITNKYEYTFSNPAGVCFSAGKCQTRLKSDNIPIFNINFTQQELDDGTSVYLREPNGVSITKDIVRFVVDRELTASEISWVELALDYMKKHINNFKD